MLCNLESAMSENVSDNEMNIQIENVPRARRRVQLYRLQLYVSYTADQLPSELRCVRSRREVTTVRVRTRYGTGIPAVNGRVFPALPTTVRSRMCTPDRGWTAVHDACRSVPMTPLARASARGPVASPVRRGRAVPVAGGGAPCGLWPVRGARAAARYFLQSL